MWWTTTSRRRLAHWVLLLAAGTALAVGCEPNTVGVTINEELMVGRWHALDNPQEHWRYDADHTGETWDTGDDVQEGEGTRFNWTAQEDQLRIDLYGEMGQHVYYDYTVTSQNDTVLVWKDLYGNQRTFTKI